MEIDLFGKHFFISKLVLYLLVVSVILVSGALGYYLNQVYQPLSSTTIEDNQSEKIQTDIIQEEKIQSGTTKITTQESEKRVEEEIKVYVVGCVNKPGVVTIKKGQIIEDAISAAGGATKTADLDNINLAFILNENSMLRIKSKNNNLLKSEVNKFEQKSKGVTSEKSQKSEAQTVLNSGVDIVSDSLGALVEENNEDKPIAKSNLININKASQADLENLPNVGPATAKAIIEYRETNGGFKQITDIMKITGIKQKTYDKIKNNICIK